MDKTILNKLVNEDVAHPIRVLYMKSMWFKSHIEVFVQDAETSRCYNGFLTEAKSIAASNELGLPVEEYFKKSYDLLTSHIPLDGYTYELNCELKKLTIKKLPLNCIFLDVDLYECDNNNEFVEDAINVFQQQSLMLRKQSDEMQEMLTKLEAVKEDFCRIAEEKDELESKLMKKFLTILNKKKMQIIDLKNRLRIYEEVDNQHVETDNDDDDVQMNVQADSIRQIVAPVWRPEIPETAGIPFAYKTIETTD